MDDSENRSSNPTLGQTPTINELIELRLSRRGLLSGIAAAGTLSALGQVASASETGNQPPDFKFREISRGLDETHHVSPGYTAEVLIRWGDPIVSGAPSFDPLNQTAAAQRLQFGYNNDYIGYVSLTPATGQDERGVLCINNEYTSTGLMLPGVTETYPDSVTREHCEIEMAGHGGSIIEVARTGHQWSVVQPSAYNRRITADSTPMVVTGPAAGHDRLKTIADPTGRLVAGTLNNCAGGMTPWGTYLMAEENFNGNFLGELPQDHPETANYARYAVPTPWYQWGNFFDRFNVGKEPNEPNRYGWMVEVDPLDPASRPKKRTAMGRFKHEGAESVVAPDGRVVFYMGDDQKFDYVYKFVTTGAYDADDAGANTDLLDDGTLYVALFNKDGTVDWMPLVYGQGPLTRANGFDSQADVLIGARLAADLLNATPMDRPEDIEPDQKSGRVWVMLTNNSERCKDNVNAANPRPANYWGQIIEITEPGGDFTATQSRWDFLVKCGDPKQPVLKASWNPATTDNGWFGSPDNCAVDPSGRLWIATDGNESTGAADGLWALATDGALRGTGQAFFRAPAGGEVCGPKFTPGGDTLFLAIQHPGDGKDASFENPRTRWPDFSEDMPPRPAIVVIRKADGGKIGS